MNQTNRVLSERMNKSTFETNMSSGILTKIEMDLLINEVMIREKQTKHSNQDIKMKIRAFKKKAMGGLYVKPCKLLAAMTLHLQALS